jgi:hypothetical protein
MKREGKIKNQTPHTSYKNDIRGVNKENGKKSITHAIFHSPMKYTLPLRRNLFQFQLYPHQLHNKRLPAPSTGF